MAQTAPGIVVFSHVDGVFERLHRSKVDRAVSRLRELGGGEIALVLCSEKTRAELELVLQQLEVCHPFVSENGGGIYVPDGYFSFDVPGARRVAGYQAIEFGRPHADVVRWLHRVAARLSIRVIGFSDMSIEQLAHVAGVPPLQAQLAKQRDYVEPFRMIDASPAARARLCKALEEVNLRCTPGASFDRVGSPVDVDVCVTSLTGLYRRANHAVMTAGVAYASSHEMLRNIVDCQVIVPDDTGSEEIDLVDWAGAILEAALELRRRSRNGAGSGSKLPSYELR
jgi:mannosyl-3-phosphoglycerate phosphatase